jgi:hypothetical protein
MKEGGMLVFSKNYKKKSNVLFVTNNEISNLFVKANLCSKKELDKLNTDNFYLYEKNSLDFDYINNNIFFVCKLENQKEAILKWKSKYDCEGDSSICNNFFNSVSLNKDDYEDLFENDNPEENKFKNYCLEFSDKNSFQIRREENNDFSNVKIDFYKAFKQLDFEYNGKSLMDLTDEDKKAIFMLGTGKSINNCLTQTYDHLCEDIYISDNEANFYVKYVEKENNGKFERIFLSFDEKLLKKSIEKDNTYKFYFLGKEIKSNELKEYDKYGVAFSNAKGFWESVSSLFGGGTDDKKIYKLEIDGTKINDIDLEKIEIYLSPNQVYRIPLKN